MGSIGLEQKMWFKFYVYNVNKDIQEIDKSKELILKIYGPLSKI